MTTRILHSYADLSDAAYYDILLANADNAVTLIFTGNFRHNNIQVQK